MGKNDLLSAMKALIEEAEAEERPLTEEEMERYEKLEGELQATQKSEEIQKRHALHVQPVNSIATVVGDNDGDTLERAFEHYVRTGQPNSDIVELRAQSKGTDSAGGYLVPEGFRQKLTERMVDFGGLASAVETISTSDGRSLEWPTVDDTGNTGEIVAEAGTFAAGADVTFGTKSLGAYKYMAGGASNVPVKVSVELLQDSAFDVQGYLARALGTRIGRVQAAHWVDGTGTAQPLGITYGVTGVEVADDTAGITYADLVTFKHSVDPAYRANAAWAFNDSTFAYLSKLVDTNGRPLINPADQALTGPNNLPTLLGYPVYIDQAFDDIDIDSNTVNWGVFGDLREAYVIRRVKDVTLVVLHELYAANGQVGFMAWARADGTVQNSNAYVALTGEAV